MFPSLSDSMTAIDFCITKHCFPHSVKCTLVAFQVPIHGSRSAHKLLLYSQELHKVAEEHVAMLTILLFSTLLV